MVDGFFGGGTKSSVSPRHHTREHARHPNDVYLNKAMGEVLTGLGLTQEARRFLWHAHSLDRDDGSTGFLIARTYERDHRFPEALVWLEYAAGCTRIAPQPAALQKAIDVARVQTGQDFRERLARARTQDEIDEIRGYSKLLAEDLRALKPRFDLNRWLARFERSIRAAAADATRRLPATRGAASTSGKHKGRQNEQAKRKKQRPSRANGWNTDTPTRKGRVKLLG